jgi:hypothetical protein
MFLEGLRKPRDTSVKIADIPVEILTKDLPNTRQERYRYASLLGCKSRMKYNSELPWNLSVVSSTLLVIYRIIYLNVE